MATRVNSFDVESLVHGKSFEEVKQIADDSGIRVRELKNGNDDLLNLYLLVSDTDQHTDNNIHIQSNGIIFEKETNKVICMSQNKFKNIVSLDMESEKMEYCEDGTVIRLYNYRNAWYTATTKCIDASHSYWSSAKTFHDMFMEIFDVKNFELLDPSFTYIFVLLHKDNRIVVDHKYNNLIYINRINNESKFEDYTNHFYSSDPRRKIRRTKQIDTVNNNLEDYFLPSKRGVIIKVYNESQNTWDIYQYDFHNYSKLKEVRGNVPLLRMRYLELLQDPESIQLLEDNYKESFFLFAMIKHQLNNLYKQIHNLYFESHVKHSITVDEENPFYRTLKQLHAQYKNTGNHITLDEVKNKVNTLDTHVLKKFMNWV
jgi:hypothetical protein